MKKGDSSIRTLGGLKPVHYLASINELKPRIVGEHTSETGDLPATFVLAKRVTAAKIQVSHPQVVAKTPLNHYCSVVS